MIKKTLVLLSLLQAANCLALNQSDCIKAVVGEAASEPYRCQVAICAVIRNRNGLQGVYGLHAKHVQNEPKYVFDKARKAWLESAKYDPTNGCDMWGGFIDDKYFMGKLRLKPVMTIGHTRFYKSKNK